MVSYTYTAMLASLIMGGLLLGLLAGPINVMTETLNDGIDDDIITDKTRHTYAWTVNMFKVILPLMILFTVITWGFTKANMGDD